jgi:hypothetical protein
VKLYLAHPLELRTQIREIELKIEQETGIEIQNPFYDSGRDDIEDIDNGKKGRSDLSLDFKAIVEKDLSSIDECDGIVAYIEKGIYTIGTLFELWNTAMGYEDKVVYVVSPDSLGHPWIRYLLDYAGGKGFSSWEEFAEDMKVNQEFRGKEVYSSFL